MILIEIRRFFRSSLLLCVSGVVVLGIGMGCSAVALSLLFASASLVSPGMRHVGYASIAEETEGGGSLPVSWLVFQNIRSSLEHISAFSAYSEPFETKLKFHGEKRSFEVALVSNKFFSNFTNSLSAGRDFDGEDESDSTRHIVIVSDHVAIKLFESSSNALGRYISINDIAYEIIGVAPIGFSGTLGGPADAWVPAHEVIPLEIQQSSASPGMWKVPATFYILASSNMLSSGKLAITLEQVLRNIHGDEIQLHVSQGLTIDPVRDQNTRRWLRFGLLLAFTFTIVSSLNYSLLLLSRTPRYIEEVRLKKALGAKRGRILLELAMGPTFMLVVSLLAAGMLWGGGLKLISMVPGFYGDLIRGSWQSGFLALGLQLPVVCGLTLLVGILPALDLARDSGAPRSTSTTTRHTGILIQLPVTLQIAFCICTWIMAGMVVSASLNVLRAPLGYDATNLSIIRLAPKTQTMTVSFTGKNSFPTLSNFSNLLEQVTAIPGVRSASFASDRFLEQPGAALRLQSSNSGSTPRAAYRLSVSPDYFRSIGATIVLGRSVAWHNSGSAINEIVVNEALAKEIWPNENPLNRTVKILNPAFAGVPSYKTDATVVGIAANMRNFSVSGSPAPTFFSSITAPGTFALTPSLIINGTVPLRSLEEFMKPQIAKFVPELKVEDTFSLQEQLQTALRPDRLRCYCALFGALIMGLVAYVGLYGALSYYVGTKRRELALRICLGARPQAIRNIILRQAIRYAVFAIFLSMPMWLILSRLAYNDFLGAASWSTARAIFLSLLCICLALCTSLIPAHSAAGLSPIEALKEE
jgi:predicted permease